MGPFPEPLGYVPILDSYQQAPKMGPNSGPVFGPTFSPFGMHFIAFTQKKRKTGNSKITISFLSTQLQQPQERCCACRNNDNDAIVLTMNQTFDTVRAAIPEKHINLDCFLKILKQKMCSRQAVSKGRLRSYKAAFLLKKLVALDGIFFLLHPDLRFQKKRAGKWFPPPKCGPKKWDRFRSPWDMCQY